MKKPTGSWTWASCLAVLTMLTTSTSAQTTLLSGTYQGNATRLDQNMYEVRLTGSSSSSVIVKTRYCYERLRGPVVLTYASASRYDAGNRLIFTDSSVTCEVESVTKTGASATPAPVAPAPRGQTTSVAGAALGGVADELTKAFARMDAERDRKEDETRRNAEAAKTKTLDTTFPVGEWGRKTAGLSGTTATDWYESGFLDGADYTLKGRANSIAALRWSPPDPLPAGVPEEWRQIELGRLGKLVNNIPTPTAYDWYGAGRLDEQESARSRPTQDLVNTWEDLVRWAWAANKNDEAKAEREGRVMLCLTRSYPEWLNRGMKPLQHGQVVFTCPK